MAVTCTFSLNNKFMSVLQCAGVGSFPAFSGLGAGRDNPAAIARQDIGPSPPGRYYIVDRESGGHLGHIRDSLLDNFYGTDRTSWFALYRNDDVIDDYTVVQGIRRGNFRLHPLGPRGISEGCITMLKATDFSAFRERLKKGPTISVPRFSGRAYGTVDVQ